MVAIKKFHKAIWKIIPDTSQKLLTVEFRSKEDKKVEYGVIDLQSHEYSPVMPLNSDNWWTGLLDFYDNVLLLHGYEEEGLPMHKGCLAYDIFSRKILWKDFEVLVKQTGKEGILTQNGKLLSWREGKTLEMEMFSPLAVERAPRQIFPSLYIEGSEEFQTWTQTISKALGEDIVGQIALARQGSYTYLQVYTGELGKRLVGHWLRRKDLANPGKGSIETLTSSPVKGLLLDAFFIELPYLFFMPEKDSLAWIDLEA